MAYPPRQFQEGYWYHIFTRQQRGAPLFYTEDDRLTFLRILDLDFDRLGAFIGGYSLLTNHYHLLARMGPVPFGRIFQTVHMKYARYFNSVHAGDGNLFKDRPGMKIVLDDSYLLQLVPYIHQNATEAGLSDNPEDYQWHSDRYYRSQSPNIDLRSWQFPSHFCGSDRTELYAELMGEEVSEDWEGGDNYIGSKSEWKSLSRREEGREGEAYRDTRGRRSKEQIANDVVRGTQWTVEDLKSPSRDRERSALRQEAMVKMYEEGYGQSEIGRFFNRSKGAVSYAIKNYDT